MKRKFVFLIIIVIVSTRAIFACACGCNVFTVGLRGSMPSSQGFTLSAQYNYMDQNRNWDNWHSAPSDLNEDQEIRTHFYTFGLQYMFDREWGVKVETPFWDRFFRTVDEDGNFQSVQHTSPGDVRLLGMYTGFDEDMSLGVQFGVKLPTGSFTLEGLDRDTQIGTGTTDVLIGAFRRIQETGWGWYAQMMWQHALNTRDEYRPGDSFDVTLAAHYDNLVSDFRIVPIVQFVGSFRGIDSGAESVPEDTGYSRLYVSPGVEVVVSQQFRLYADVRIPIVTQVRGNQLVAPALVSISAGVTL